MTKASMDTLVQYALRKGLVIRRRPDGSLWIGSGDGSSRYSIVFTGYDDVFETWTYRGRSYRRTSLASMKRSIRRIAAREGLTQGA